ncbi:uncharacterized protein TNCV_3923661 [Trichonephila clavipes]|nr:uncharacterized protein TNCV_3923661 [Trichonephila clavipes]
MVKYVNGYGKKQVSQISSVGITVQKEEFLSITPLLLSSWESIFEHLCTVSDRLTNTFKKEFLCLDNEHIFGGDQEDIPEIIEEILTTARDLELEVNEDDIEELIMGHEDELTIEDLQVILKEHQETQRNVSPSEQDEDERGPMPTSAIKDLLKKWKAVKAMVLESHPNQADASRFGDLYNDNAINYFRKILKKREQQSTLDMFINAP